MVVEKAIADGLGMDIDVKNSQGVLVVEEDGVEAHVGADESFELVGRDFAEAFESGDFGARGGVDGLDAFFVGVAVFGFLLVAHTEEGCLENIYVTGTDEFGVESKEEGEQQQSDVHAVDIGIGGDDYVIVA